MTTIELARKVQAMRTAQKVYFKSRDIKSLDQSKRLERELDKLLAEILADKPARLPIFEDDLKEMR